MRRPPAIPTALALLAIAMPPSAGAKAPTGSAASVTLRAETADLGRVALATGRPDDDRVAHHEVSDLLVRLHPVEGVPLATALLLDNVEHADRGRARTIMTVELLVVSGGRLHVEERARCTAWVGDAATCRTECEGGAFVIARARGADRMTLRLVVGEIVPGTGAGGSRLAACREHGDGIETSLAPRRGPLAEVALARD